MSRVNFAASLSTVDASFVLKHAEHFSLGLVICDTIHGHQFYAMLGVPSILEVVSLTLVHDEHDAVIDSRELLVREAWWIHLKLGLADVRFILRMVVAHPRLT